MKIKKEYIKNGPNRESIFDSLRLKLPVSFSLVQANGQFIDAKAYVLAIKRIKINSIPNHEWELEVKLVKTKYEPARVLKISYSTFSREGIII